MKLKSQSIKKKWRVKFMVVALLLKLLEDYELCSNGVQVQFVSHKKGSFWADEVYEDCVLVTPYDKDGELNTYRSRYYHGVRFSDWKKRSSFYKLMSRYNEKNHNKDGFVPLHHLGVGNYCTIV